MIRAAAMLFSGSLLGKLLGIVRELLLAAAFGVASPVGALRIAQSATLIPVNFFTSDTLNAGFIPIYTRYSKQDPAKAQTFFWTLYIGLSILSLLIAGLLVWSASWWVAILAPGFDPRTGLMAASFVQIMALGVPFYVAGALFSFLEMANGRYWLMSLRASLQSIGMISGTLTAYWLKQPIYLAWGFTGAYVVFSLWGVASLCKQRLLSWPRELLWSEVKSVLGRFWRTIRPLLLLPVILQGNIAVERAVASLMGVDVIAGLDYAKFITETGVVLLAVPLGLAGLSEFSKLSIEESRDQLIQILPVILVLTIPLSAFILVHNDLVIRLLYARGAFGEESIALTKSILFGLGAGFWAQVVGYVLIKALSAQIRNKEVLIIMAIALGLNALANVLLFRALGPLALGVGASLYGLGIFGLSVHALKLYKNIFGYLVWLMVGVSVYIPFGLWFNSYDGLIGVGVVGFGFVGFWLIYLTGVPLLRGVMVPIWGRICRSLN